MTLPALICLLVVTHAVAAVAGAVAWHYLAPLHAVSTAKSLVDKAAAEVKKLEAAKKLVAALTGPSGSTGATVVMVPTVVKAPTGPTGA